MVFAYLWIFLLHLFEKCIFIGIKGDNAYDDIASKIRKAFQEKGEDEEAVKILSLEEDNLKKLEEEMQNDTITQIHIPMDFKPALFHKAIRKIMEY